MHATGNMLLMCDHIAIHLAVYIVKEVQWKIIGITFPHDIYSFNKVCRATLSNIAVSHTTTYNGMH